MLTDVLRDAWQQYRRHPLALLPAIALQFSPALDDSPSWLQIAVGLPQFLLALLVNLFLIVWLAGAVDGSGTLARDALRTAARSMLRSLPVALVAFLYVGVALYLATAMVTGSGDQIADEQLPIVAIGSAPLVVAMIAFLAVAFQPVALDGAKAFPALAISHRVAWSWFGICLLISLPDGIHWALDAQPLPLAARLAMWTAVGLTLPFTLGMANALYLRTRVPAEPEPADRP
jgi:hypothetical protein